MAFKMNKNNVNFGEGTGSSPNKFIGAVIGGLALRNRLKKRNEDKRAGAQGEVVSDPGTQDAQDPNLEANKAAKLGGFGGIARGIMGGGGSFGGGINKGGSLKDRLRSILQELENKE